MVSPMRAWFPAAAVAFAIGCGGSNEAPTSPTGGIETRTFTGTTRALGPGNCTGDAHAFTAGEGAITVTLTQTSPPEALTAEICAPNVTDKPRDCTLPRTRIDVGQTITAVRKISSAQSLSLLPLTCGAEGPVSASPITYTATVMHQR